MNIFDSIGDNWDEFDPSKHWANQKKALGFTKDMPPRPGYETELLQNAERMRGESNLFLPIIGQRMRDITDTRGESYRARATAGADAAQANTAGSPFQRAMTRGRALSRIAMQGQTAVEGQSMRDRIGMARFGQGIRAGTNRDLASLSGVQGETTAANMRASQITNAGYANAAGTLVGAASNYWTNRRAPQYSGTKTYPATAQAGGVVT